MPKHPVIASIRAVLVALFCVFAYVQWVHVTTIETSLLSRLAVKVPGVPLVNPKASSHMVLDMTTSPFTAALAAYKHNPGETGGYSTIWNGPPATKRSAVMVFNLLPTPAIAKLVLAQARREFFSPKAFKQYVKEVPVAVPGIPGVTAYHLYSAATAQDPASQTVMIIFGFQRVSVVELVSALSLPPSDATTLAHREYACLLAVEPTFTMEFTTRPIVGSIFYWLGALIAVSLAFIGPTLFVERRRQLETDRAAAAVRHKQVRGSKNLRRRSQARR